MTHAEFDSSVRFDRFVEKVLALVKASYGAADYAHFTDEIERIHRDIKLRTEKEAK